ncbi:MAG: class I SAM-dependent methyltransferase [Bryobacteraceae bacterium]|nr:class I SAM-dependent methyltransferase [Bryobacteraceae bacterium]
MRSQHHALVDLLPVLHARDRAEAKVAAIGSVNPRAPGLVNDAIQWVKHNVARALGWFVRDQVDFNRAVLGAVEATLESLNEVNRTFATLSSRIDDMERGFRHDLRGATDAAAALQSEAGELKDIRAHWVHWREEWQQKLFQNEVHYLRGLADLQSSLDVRVAKIDDGYRDSLHLQHNEYEGALRGSIDEIHKRFWSDMEKVRREYETLIHNELRVMRQKAFASATPVVALPAAAVSSDAPLDIDYNRFSDRFRGDETYVRERQQFYIPYFRECQNVLDIGCGRGEFLELLRDASVPARGLDLDDESVAICRTKGLQAETGDVFVWLASEPDGSFDGIFASQVIEHLTPSQVPRFVKLCAEKLRHGGVIALETPNPECLAIFATHFYIDPTHQRPVPAPLLVFYFEEFGLGNIEVHKLSPAGESMPTVNELPAGFRDAFFGGLDYCGIARKL